ncbi:MAG TPA: N-acetylmuramoyl-L-alanine amidase [Thermoanaerobaculia bacterium]|jgi:N-acetylmuramoyl-L-alanine amidase
MANVDRIKRQLLRDLVQQNVDLAEGRLPRGLRQGRRWGVAVRVMALALLSLALFGSSRLISSRLDSPPREHSPAAGARAATRTAAPPAVPAQLLTTPQPVDAAVFPLAVHKIVIDAGHGGESTGTRTPQGLLEKDLTLDIAQRLRRILAQQSFDVVMTRDADHDVSLKERGGLANRVGGDIFVSIHLNWIVNRRSRGVETYYMGATDDPYLTRLAAAENRESGYSLADMRRLLDRIYAGVRQEKSRKLAETVQSSLFQSLGKVSPEIENRGVKTAPFIVLLTTDMPAILAEVSSLSSEEEARLLTKPLYRQYIAEALAKGIRAYAETVEEAPEVDAAARKESR